MRKAEALTGIAGVVSAIAAAGRLALVGAGVMMLAVIMVLCWVLASTDRTARLVRLIRALRGR